MLGKDLNIKNYILKRLNKIAKDNQTHTNNYSFIDDLIFGKKDAKHSSEYTDVALSDEALNHIHDFLKALDRNIAWVNWESEHFLREYAVDIKNILLKSHQESVNSLKKDF